MTTPEKLLEAAAIIMEHKAADYTSDPNARRFENFERAAFISNWFEMSLDRVFATLIAIKLARLATLLNSDKQPNNESVEDSFKDLINYAALWASAVESNVLPPEE